MRYPFECGSCGAQVTVERPVDLRDGPMACECGASMKRVPALPMRCHVARHDHRDFDGDDWGVHQEAQEDIEWKTALGLADGEKGKGPRSARSRPDEIARKREHIAKGGPVPDSATIGHILPHERHLYVSPDKAIQQAENALAAS